jgi:hypothetical protein
MLLIAQPKSASTSLAHTFAKMFKLKIKEGIPKKYYDIECEGFSEIQLHHCNMVERGSSFLENAITNKGIIYREHIIPTERHLKIIQKIDKNIVVLLRKPEDSLDSYLRMKKIIVNEKQLKDDLILFNEKYTEFAKNNKRILLITFERLMLHYWHTMKDIILHYGFNMPKKIIPLQKRKYTGIGERRLRK